jgi:general secretion pathway protein D
VTADERTNQIILITPPGNLAIIMDVIQSVDVDAAPLTASEVFQLRQAKAEEVVPIIEDIISGQKEGREEDAQVARENERTNNANNRGNNNAPAVAVNAPTPSAGFIEANSSLQFSNFVGLAADERTNAIVAYGTQQDLKTLKELIEKIDIPLPQVRIEAIITEVTLNENQSSGISALGFSVGADGDVNFGGSVQTGIGDDGDKVNSLGGLIGTGFNLTGNTNPAANANDAFVALLTASDGDSNVRVLSTPTIVISHNEEGTINVSESRPIITGSSSTLNNNSSTNVRSNVEFRDIGIQLTVTPLIGAAGSVQMQIEQVVDNIAGETTIDGNVQPIIGRREANSTVTVKDREIIILGGLQENRRTENNSYFPLLKVIPGLNKFLGGESASYVRTELVIFIRPTIIKTPEDSQALSEEKIEAIEEGKAVKKYIETDTLGRLYMEGSKFEEEEPRETKGSIWPRFLRR